MPSWEKRRALRRLSADAYIIFVPLLSLGSAVLDDPVLRRFRSFFGRFLALPAAIMEPQPACLRRFLFWPRTAKIRAGPARSARRPHLKKPRPRRAVVRIALARGSSPMRLCARSSSWLQRVRA